MLLRVVKLSRVDRRNSRRGEGETRKAPRKGGKTREGKGEQGHYSQQEEEGGEKDCRRSNEGRRREFPSEFIYFLFMKYFFFF